MNLKTNDFYASYPSKCSTGDRVDCDPKELLHCLRTKQFCLSHDNPPQYHLLVRLGANSDRQCYGCVIFLIGCVFFLWKPPTEFRARGYDCKFFISALIKPFSLLPRWSCLNNSMSSAEIIEPITRRKLRGGSTLSATRSWLAMLESFSSAASLLAESLGVEAVVVAVALPSGVSINVADMRGVAIVDDVLEQHS
mmetsp:Transcript_97679/g.153945  ORF Transcript_97679/g.153945 Transcript_97679/m.153945 type:complete len:195 (+) Transcript_97679:1-585(+)